MFFLSILIVPSLFWYYAIAYQLDRKINPKNNSSKTIVLLVLLSYCLIYFFSFICVIFSVFQPVNFTVFDTLFIFHLLAVACTLTLIIVATRSFTQYEAYIGEKTLTTFDAFWNLSSQLYGVWNIQPKLNEYIKEKPSL